MSGRRTPPVLGTLPSLLAIALAVGGAGCAGGAGGTGEGGSSGGGSGRAGTGGGATGDGGTGGAAGSAGGAGGRGGSGGAPTGTGGNTQAGRCPADAILCADFEDGALPAGMTFFPEYLRPMQGTFVSIDATSGHASTRSLKVTSSSSSQMLGIATGTATFWVRVYIQATTEMAHDTFIEATDGDGDPNRGEHVRIGTHYCQLELNRSSDDRELLSNGGTYVCSGGIVFEPTTWRCLEAFFDGPASEVRVFVDGNEVTAMHGVGWGPYVYTMFKLGYEQYGGSAQTLHYDDVALASERIGCLP